MSELDLSDYDTEGLTSEIWAKGRSDGRVDGIGESRAFVADLAAKAFLEGDDNKAQLLRSVSERLGALAESKNSERIEHRERAHAALEELIKRIDGEHED